VIFSAPSGGGGGVRETRRKRGQGSNSRWMRQSFAGGESF
jgi:hypothetical protein